MTVLMVLDIKTTGSNVKRKMNNNMTIGVIISSNYLGPDLSMSLKQIKPMATKELHIYIYIYINMNR